MEGSFPEGNAHHPDAGPRGVSGVHLRFLSSDLKLDGVLPSAISDLPSRRTWRLTLDDSACAIALTLVFPLT
ncbi:hypothetical protein LshimejAT787_0905330 [Lyophyllum shimeji]|uniref:Uncharacterized protein n=1 Tax=Lyophyllum shimeji TaxID=47721 RepID=A0A9P3UQ46_LYOSH|nr:hypothetical protein LshimejAT787_0905330 [Lyophyllum shimeji]